MQKKKIKKWNLYNESVINLVPSQKDREWMKNTPNSFAFRCLPLTIANGFGWTMLNKDYTEIIWDGNPDIKSTVIKCFDKNKKETAYPWASSHFGSGVVTFSFDFIFETELGHNLYVKGPANNPKRGITALEGIIETDWLPFTFTYNFKFIKPGKIKFEKDQPLFSLFPVERGYVEGFDTLVSGIDDYPEFKKEYDMYSNHRLSQKAGITEIDGHYGRAETPAKKHDVENHLKTSKIKEFKY
jgi:hypothetical protein